MGDYADMETDRSMNDWIDDGCPRTEVRPSTAKRKRRTMTQQTETTAIAVFDKIAAGLAELRKRYEATVVVVDTPERMASAKKSRAEIREVRYSIKPAHKKAKEQIIKDGRAIDGEAKRLTAEVRALEDPYDEAIREVEQKEEREKEEKERIKAEHQAKCLAEIDRIRNVPVEMVGRDLDTLQSASDDLGALDLSWLTESADVARITRADAMAKLEDMRAAAESQEKERTRIAKERAEFEALRAEQEARARAEREEREAEATRRAEIEDEARAKQAAEDRARREKLEADEQEARERIAEEARRSREATEKADREARELRAKQEAEARQRREAEELKLKKERERIAEQEREALREREKADAEARKAREVEEAHDRQERERVEAEREAKRKAEKDLIDAEQERIEAEYRARQRERDTLLDGRNMLETFVERYGEISEFASVANSIQVFLDRGGG